MSAEKKPIYTFTINKKIEKSVSETTTDDAGAEITKTTKQIVDDPVKVVIKRPSRRQEDQAEEEYSVQLSRLMKLGVFTQAMLSDHIKNGTGNLLSEKDAERYNNLIKQYFDLTEKYQVHVALDKDTEGYEEKKESLVVELAETEEKIWEFKTYHKTLFENTAEFKASTKVMLWYFLNLTHLEEGGKIVPLFKGTTFKEKEDLYYELEEAREDFYSELSEKAIKVVAIWFHNKNISEKDLEQSLEKMFGK